MWKKEEPANNNEKDNKDVESVSGFQSKDPIIREGATVEHPTTFLETLMHLFKGNIGSGIFAMGDAFRHAGLIFAPIITLFLGVICVHAQHLLIRTSLEVQKRVGEEVMLDYATTVELVFSTGPPPFKQMGIKMRRVVNFFLCVTQFGFCCVYFVFISNNIKKVADAYDFVISENIWMVIILVPILLSCLIRNLKYLAPLSMAANVFMIAGIITTFYFTSQDIPSPRERDYIASWRLFPLYFGTAIFAFEGIGLVLPLRNEMEKPKLFGRCCGVLNLGMTLVTTLFISVGFMSYLKYGDDIAGSVTLNFENPILLAHIIQIVIATGVLLGYALQFYIPIEIMWPTILEKFGPLKYPVFAELCFRTFFVLITFTLAELIPFLDLFISLVGAVSSSALALMFPPILDIVLHLESNTLNKWRLSKDVFIILIGVVGFATGTYASINEIIKKYQEDTV